MRFKLIFLLFATLLIFLISCDDSANGGENGKEGDYGVSFYDRGSLYCFTTVDEGGLSPEPAEPEWNGYDFVGWYYGNAAWNFSADTVGTDVTLTAKWRVNFKTLLPFYQAEGVWLSEDGERLKIDTNPKDEIGVNKADILAKIKNANEALGLPDSLYQEMLYTLTADGVRTAEGAHVTVEWSNSPNTGLEVTYTRK